MREQPTYQSLGDHTECFQVDYDPAQTTFEELLKVFWADHDPTSSAWSRQYKAILFFHDEAQKKAALASRDRLAKELGTAITTEVRPALTFWRAEDYHQKYALRGHALLAQELRAKHASEQAFVDDPLVTRVNGWLEGSGDLAVLERDVGTFGLSEAARKDLLATARAHVGSGPGCPK